MSENPFESPETPSDHSPRSANALAVRLCGCVLLITGIALSWETYSVHQSWMMLLHYGTFNTSIASIVVGLLLITTHKWDVVLTVLIAFGVSLCGFQAFPLACRFIKYGFVGRSIGSYVSLLELAIAVASWMLVPTRKEADKLLRAEL